mgnify:FL=1
MESHRGIKNLKNYVNKIIISKRLINQIFLNASGTIKTNQPSDKLELTKLFPTLFNEVGDPRKKINEIQSYFESYGYTVKLEK